VSDLFTTLHKPDVLSCLSDLSNDEVFTTPNIVDDMLDLLPKDLFENPNITFLDPVCKSGVFLREIAKRLIKGLEPIIPDLQERLDHIFHKQLYGIAITELTSLLSRRSVYCSKYPNSPYSVSQFDDIQGNIRYKQVEHEWIKGKCCFCGATESEYGTTKREGMESHAYEFIHTVKPQEIFKMKFDVIIGNPPYQLNDGGNGASAKPIYHHFIEQAKKLNPRYLTMIIPARWYAGGKGLDEFRNAMLSDNRLVYLHDFVDASECFSGVEIKGGVCYFLWDKEHKGDCTVVEHRNKEIISTLSRSLIEKGSDTFIRYNRAINILRKIRLLNEKTFDCIVSPRKPFGLPSDFKAYSKTKGNGNDLFIYAQKDTGYVNKSQILKNKEWINLWKVYIPEAIGSGNMETDLLKPLLGEPNSVCSETYLVINPTENKQIAESIISYMKTKFFHFLLGLKKITQHTTQKTYSFVPMQDFSKCWTDEELYKKYNLTQDEIDFIESMIRPMD
jgi:site-specific DNA-methyltransferase (adenine-specific)